MAQVFPAVGGRLEQDRSHRYLATPGVIQNHIEPIVLQPDQECFKSPGELGHPFDQISPREIVLDKLRVAIAVHRLPRHHGENVFLDIRHRVHQQHGDAVGIGRGRVPVEFLGGYVRRDIRHPLDRLAQVVPNGRDLGAHECGFTGYALPPVCCDVSICRDVSIPPGESLIAVREIDLAPTTADPEARDAPPGLDFAVLFASGYGLVIQPDPTGTRRG